MREQIKALGNRIEPKESSFHLVKMDTEQEMARLERSLEDEDRLELLVSKLRRRNIKLHNKYSMLSGRVRVIYVEVYYIVYAKAVRINPLPSNYAI